LRDGHRPPTNTIDIAVTPAMITLFGWIVVVGMTPV
jgi:hypothetical protein